MAGEQSTLCAKDIMRSRVPTLQPEASLAEAIRFLTKQRASGAPVVDNGLVLGYLSDAECLDHLANELFHGSPSPRLTVRSMMQLHPICVDPSIQIFPLASVFVSHKLLEVPVVDRDHRLLGIVARGTVLEELDKFARRVESAQELAHQPLDLHELVNHRFLVRSP